MKITTFNLLLYTAAMGLVLCRVHPVLAHGDEPRLEISPERSNPGGVVDLRGFDFEREEVITLMLVNSSSSVSFGEILADVEGGFLLNLALPVDLAEGTYTFLAITDDHRVVSPELTVQGPPIESGAGDEGVRDQEEPLLAPMPTFALGEVPVGGLPPTAQPETQPTGSVPNATAIALIASAVLIAAVLALLGLRVMRKK